MEIISDVQEIEGGLMLTMEDGSKWRLDATLLEGREITEQEPEKPECFGDWYPGNIVCIRRVGCAVWRECQGIWTRKKESAGNE